jgi:5-formyltetrahydrofolate cyclo-ligase
MVFDSGTEALLRARAKVELRKRMRALRTAVPEAARGARSERIVGHIAASAPFARADRVALFFPMVDEGEVDLRGLDRIARDRGKRVLYPALTDVPGEMALCYASPLDLEDRGHRFLEPRATDAPGETGPDLLIVAPALAIALDGHRIGYGKGYYDRLLARMAPPAVSMVVAYDFQLVAEIPITPTDRSAQWLVTDTRIEEAKAAGPG